MNQATIVKIFEILKKENPDPQTKLLYHTPFELLIAVMLSAQATDHRVNQVTPTLFKMANTPEAMIQLGESLVKKIIKSIGLYNTKAKNILKTSKRLIDHFNGQLPHDRKALESLPGVGRKTAHVVLNVLFQEPVIAVDTHVLRIAQRIGFSYSKTFLAVERDLMQCIPKQYLVNVNHWLVLHGRYICKARQPLCTTCPIKKYCEYSYKSNVF